MKMKMKRKRAVTKGCCSVLIQLEKRTNGYHFASLSTVI